MGAAREKPTCLLFCCGAVSFSRAIWILVEVLQGFRQKQHMEEARRALLSLPCVDMVGKEVALASATNYRLLCLQGITARKTIDVIIATFCIRHGHVLLHADRDFEPMVEHLGLRAA